MKKHLLALISVLVVADTARAQLETEGPFGSKVRLEVSDRIRYERFAWFETDPASATRDYDYGFFANRLQMGLRVTRDPVEFFVQYQHSLITSLPDHGPGPGGAYYTNTPDKNQEKGILRNIWLRWKNPFGAQGLSLTAGRQIFRDGLEAPATDPTLLWLQKSRLSERLIGPFDYTHVGRSFDGGQLAFDNTAMNVTGFAFTPTWGGYEINANRELEIGVAGVSASLKALEALPGTNARIFRLALGNGAPFTLIGNDGGLLASSVGVATIDLSPGERVDLLVDFRDANVGDTVMLRDQRTGWDLLEFRVVRRVSDPSTIPTVLSSITKLKTPVRTRTTTRWPRRRGRSASP